MPHRPGSAGPALLAAGDVGTSIDPVALHHYVSCYDVAPAPRIILTGVRNLLPATVCVIVAGGSSDEHRYWNTT